MPPISLIAAACMPDGAGLGDAWVGVRPEEVHALAPGASPLAAGEEAWLTFRRYHLFERESGRRLSSHPIAA